MRPTIRRPTIRSRKTEWTPPKLTPKRNYLRIGPGRRTHVILARANTASMWKVTATGANGPVFCSTGQDVMIYVRELARRAWA